MAETLRLEIVTPQATVFSEDVHMVTLPGIEGQIGVYPQHVRLITQIVPGEIIVHKDGRRRFSPSAKGSSRSPPDRVAIVTDMAIPADNIDEAKAEEARERAAARLREKISDEEVASVNASLARSLAQLQVKTPAPDHERTTAPWRCAVLRLAARVSTRVAAAGHRGRPHAGGIPAARRHRRRVAGRPAA